MFNFATIFESIKFGQILVFKDTDDDQKPCLRFAVVPSNLGTCFVVLSYNDDDDGWAKRDAAFDKLNLEMVEVIVAKVFEFDAAMEVNDGA